MGNRQKKMPTDRTNAGKGGKAAQQKGVDRELDREAEAETGQEAAKALGGRAPGGSHRRGGGRVVSGASAEARSGSLDADIAKLPGARARGDERTIRDDRADEATTAPADQAGDRPAKVPEAPPARKRRSRRQEQEPTPEIPAPGADRHEIEHQLAHRRRSGKREDAGTASPVGPRGPRADGKKILMRQSSVAPRAEPSTRGANHWVSGRRNERKTR